MVDVLVHEKEVLAHLRSLQQRHIGTMCPLGCVHFFVLLSATDRIVSDCTERVERFLGDHFREHEPSSLIEGAHLIRAHYHPAAQPGSSSSSKSCLLYTSDAADEEDSVDLGGRRIIKKKKKEVCL
eukprot:TRINITY_DN60518_c0_g1_i1.p2 TRINITY_DN60518_c0_g1~~TRINITY_DN60518_c0_g1_i1.p2  ORF type:complete len:126 (-),score=33.02 TRINITY_DN60518_c0_g1_i1:10-387(-)